MKWLIAVATCYLTLLIQARAYIYCNNAYSCALAAINATSTDTTIECNGFKSCFGSPYILNLNNNAGLIGCYGSYSCANSSLIVQSNNKNTSNTSHIYCWALRSCSNINKDGIYLKYKGRVECKGEQSCLNSHIYLLAGNISNDNGNRQELSRQFLDCHGQLSCANSTITLASNSSVSLGGYLSGYNTRFISLEDTRYKFYGRDSGYKATVICASGKICNIECRVSGCDGLTLKCEDETDIDLTSCTFELDCDWSDKNHLCSGEDDLSWYKELNTSMNLNETLAYVLSEEYTIEGSGLILECGDYLECRYFHNVMNNSNVSKYIDLVYENDSTTYVYLKSMIPIVCNGRESCFFTNIVIDYDYTTSASDNGNVFLACDGYASCNNISSYIKLTDLEKNISTSAGTTTSSDYSISARFSAVHWYSIVTLTVESSDKNNVYSNCYYNDCSEILCTGFDSCYHLTMVNVHSVHCHGWFSCSYAIISNVGDSIWMYSQESAIGAVINGVGNDLHFAGTFSCYLCNVANVNGNIYAIGPWSMRFATITNVSGEIFGVRQGSLANTTIKNVPKILCSGDRCCEYGRFFSIAWIEQRQDQSLNRAEIYSDMIHHHNKFNDDNNNSNNSIDNKYNKYNNNRTMTVLLYGSNEELTIYCSYQDICRIGCFDKDACSRVDLYCNGTCLVDCDDSTTYQCPVIKLGDYSVWYSTINDDSSDNGNNTSGNGNGNGDVSGGSGDENGQDLTLYDSIVATFAWLTGIVAVLIIIGVCTYQCRKVYLVGNANRFHVHKKRSTRSLNERDDSDTGSSIKDDIVIVAGDDDDKVNDQTEERLRGLTRSRSTTTARVVNIWIACCNCGCGYGEGSAIRKNGSTNENQTENQNNLNWILFLIKIYFCHSDFVVFVIVFVACIFLSMICGLYGFGQITQLVLSNYWCDKKDLDTIYQHSIEYGLNQGTNEECWTSKQFKVNTNALFDSESVYTTSTDLDTTNIVKCIIWLFYSASLCWIAVLYMTLQLAQLGIGRIWVSHKSLKKHQNTDTNISQNAIEMQVTDRSPQIQNEQEHPNRCLSCCACWNSFLENSWTDKVGNFFKRINRWYEYHFGEDTQNWFVLLSVRELIEIILQIFAVYNYNGLDVFDANDSVLAYKEFDIKLFCVLLSVNCLLTGILWLFYIFCHGFCHGIFFKNLIFVTDAIFDTFYALFPIVIVTNQHGRFNTQLAVAVLQSTNLFCHILIFCFFLNFLSFHISVLFLHFFFFFDLFW